MSLTWLDIITASLRELGVLNAVDPPSGEDAAFCLGKAQELIDAWNAERRAVYADTITAYPLIASQNPHTIGPSGSGADFIVASRPLSIEGANILTPDGIHTPLTIRDAAWWMARPSTASTTPIPSDLYPELSWPLGKLWLWYGPSTAHDLELRVRTLLTVVASLNDTFDLPPGYREAITLTLAERLAAPYRVSLSPMTVETARYARARIFSVNSPAPKLITSDDGIPNAGGSGFYDYRTRELT